MIFAECKNENIYEEINRLKIFNCYTLIVFLNEAYIAIVVGLFPILKANGNLLKMKKEKNQEFYRSVIFMS